MPYSMEQRATLAQAIDKILGTNEATSNATSVDLTLGWLNVLVTRLQTAETALAAAQTQIKLMQSQMSSLIAKG